MHRTITIASLALLIPGCASVSTPLDAAQSCKYELEACPEGYVCRVTDDVCVERSSACEGDAGGPLWTPDAEPCAL